MRDEEARLVRGIQAGDTGAMAELVQRHYRLLFEVHWLLRDDVAEAGRLTQETFAAAWRSPSSSETHQSVRAWLLSLAVGQLEPRSQGALHPRGTGWAER